MNPGEQDKQQANPQCPAVATYNQARGLQVFYCDYPRGHDGDHSAQQPGYWVVWSSITGLSDRPGYIPPKK